MTAKIGQNGGSLVEERNGQFVGHLSDEEIAQLDASVLTYTCEMCKGVFESDRTDEDAKQEYDQLFGGEPNETDDAVVCEECFNKLFG